MSSYFGRADRMARPEPKSARGDRRAPAAPDIDRDEQEQPHDVDEMPIPGRGFEAEMLAGREIAAIGADQVHDQEDRSDQNVEAVEAGRHEEGGAVAAAFEG